MHAILTIAPSQNSLSLAVAHGLARVEERFRLQLDTPIAPVAELVGHVERYRGKMLRPTLLLLCAQAANPDQPDFSEDQIIAATVVEMIHMATLVHDDVLDEADVRRGGDTVNRRRGNEAAVILGDYLISKAFHLCSGLESQRTALRVGEVTSIVCEGEMLQNHHRGDLRVSRETYYDIIERKTAALIAVACELGATHAGLESHAGERSTLRLPARLHEFGRLLGVAFQIQDDLLDLVGDERIVGKSVGRDLAKGTLTLPIIHHLESLASREREAAEARLRDGAGVNGKRAGLADMLAPTGSLDFARATAQSLVDQAKALIASELPDSPARATLLSIADAVVKRQF
jgi:octaprenyl-diphosphate synthase